MRRTRMILLMAAWLLLPDAKNAWDSLIDWSQSLPRSQFVLREFPELPH